MSEINREEQNGDRPDVVIEIPSEGESEPAKKKKRSKWTVIDIVVAWLPAIAAVCGIVKWIMEIVRCFSGGAYEAQCTNCTRLFSVEFLPRYYEPVLFWIAGVTLGIGLLYAIFRFYRLAKTGKRVAFTVLFLLALLIAAPIALIWGLHDYPDAPLMQALIQAVGEERLSAFFHANQWIYRSAFPYILLGVSALFLLISLRLVYFDERSENRRFFSYIVILAAIIFLGIPLLILLSQNAVLAICLAFGVTVAILSITIPKLIVFFINRKEKRTQDTLPCSQEKKKRDLHMSDHDSEALRSDYRPSFVWNAMDSVALWLPFLNVVMAVVMSIICFSRTFTVKEEFFDSYWHPVPLYICLAITGFVMLWSLIRFYRMSSRGKKIAASILLGLSLVAAAPLWIYLILALRYDVPNVQSTISYAEAEALIAFLRGLGRVMPLIVAIILLVLSAILMIVAWCFVWFDRPSKNTRFFLSGFGGALIYLLGAPLLYTSVYVIIALIAIIAAILVVLFLMFLAVGQSIGESRARVRIGELTKESKAHRKEAAAADAKAARSVLGRYSYEREAQEHREKAASIDRDIENIRRG